jgi:Flp pilus assembly protein TadG
MRRITEWPAGWRRLTARWSRDDRGIAAVEFAMIAPLMIVMFFGMIDVSMGVGVDRKVTLVSQAMSDLASRYVSVNDTDITNFFSIGNAMLAPYGTADLTATITEIYIDPKDNGKGKVQWSKGSAVLTVGSTVALPDGLISKNGTTVLDNQYLIMADVKYVYKPIIGYVVPKAGLTLGEKSYTRPRQSICVFYPSVPSPNTCPTTVK